MKVQFKQRYTLTFLKLSKLPGVKKFGSNSVSNRPSSLIVMPSGISSIIFRFLRSRSSVSYRMNLGTAEFDSLSGSASTVLVIVAASFVAVFFVTMPSVGEGVLRNTTSLG